MTIDPELRDLLIEIRDDQKLSLQRQEEHLAVARDQLDRSRRQVEESIGLQRQAMDRVRLVSRVAIPGIAVCVALILFLVIRYL